MMRQWIDRNVFGLFMLVICTGGLVDKYQTHSQRGMAAWGVMLVLSMVALYRNYHRLKPKLLTPAQAALLDKLGTFYLNTHRAPVVAFFRRYPDALQALDDARGHLLAFPQASIHLVDRFDGHGGDALTVVIQAPWELKMLEAELGQFALWWLSEPRAYPICFEVRQRAATDAAEPS